MKIILNLDKWFRRRCHLKISLKTLFLVEHYREHPCKLMLHLDVWFKRCCFKIFFILF